MPGTADSTVETMTVTIFAGTLCRRTGALVPPGMIERTCEDYCNAVGLCVTVTPTTFIYVHGREPGAAIGLINYPRFPSSERTIRAHALRLARHLLRACKQQRISVVFPDKTLMLTNRWEGA